MKNVESTSSERHLLLVTTILKSKRPTPLTKFRNEETWGSERTFRRTRRRVNDTWEREFGEPLFDLVNDFGEPVDKLDHEVTYVRRVWNG